MVHEVEHDVFDDAAIWLNLIQGRRPMIALVSRRPAEGRGDVPIDERVVAGSRFLCGEAVLRRFAGSVRRNTDDYPILEYSAAASHLRHTRAETQRMAVTLRDLAAEERGGHPAGM